MNKQSHMIMTGAVLGAWLLGNAAANAFSPATFPLPPPPAAQEWKASVRGLTGVISGEAYETVYDGSHKLSELQWDISGVGIGGVSLAIQRGERWMAYGSFVMALTKGEGEMQDYDWLEEDMGWSNYSRCDVDIDSAWIGDVGLSRQLSRGQCLNVRAVIGFSSQQWEWKDGGKEYVYSVGGFRNKSGSYGGIPLIEYRQTYYIPYLGAQVEGGKGRWAWSAYLLFGPYVWAEDWDYHIARDLHFEGTFRGGAWIGAGWTAEWRMTPDLAFAAGLHLQSIPEFKGDMRIVEMGETYEDSAAVSHDSVSLTLSFRWSF